MDQKPKVFTLNNYIVNKTDRLSSLSKRDLSLGGKQPKKVYKPNLSAIRNKAKSDIEIDNTTSQRQSSEKRAVETVSKRRQYVRSRNLFSQGAGQYKRNKRCSGRYLTKAERDQMEATTSKIIKWEVNIPDENTVINELLADDNDDDPVENEGTIGNLFSCDVPLSFQNNNLYNENRLCISLVRMPDMLLTRGFLENPKKITNIDFTKMMEGRIGRVLIRKSGQIEIQIGDTKFALDSLEMNPFKEDIMSISQNLTSSSFEPKMINLGNIDEKYILSLSLKNLYPLKVIKKRKLRGKK